VLSAKCHGNLPPDFASSLKADYRASGLDRVADRFVLYRIIGNDLPPLHKVGQSRENVEFILRHEPKLADCAKRWVINRIADSEEEQAIVALLERYQQPYLRLPFHGRDYFHTDWDFESFPFYGYSLSEEFIKLRRELQMRIAFHAYRHKNRYAMNNNGARNAALAEGRAMAKWVLPWDGNCFLTASAWEEIRKGVAEAPHHKYFVVPMARITDNTSLLADSCDTEAIDEPQIVFRKDAGESFDPEYPYGRRSKVELFWRLGIPGPWDRWTADRWDPPFPRLSPEAGASERVGWVARLASGASHLDGPTKSEFKNRGLARNAAVVRTLVRLDARYIAEYRRGLESDLVYYRAEQLDRLKAGRDLTPADTRIHEEIRHHATAALERGPYSVVGKTATAPSDDPHDYWHPVPYWWPAPRGKGGRPCVRRYGERVPSAEMCAKGDAQYDRTSVQRLFEDTTSVALAWYLTGDTRFAEHGARLVTTWFSDPATRMNPHLRYAQVRLGHNEDGSASSGIIEFKDVYYFLDAVRMLSRSDALRGSDLHKVREWFATYLDWLLCSEQGQQEMRASDNHGTLYDLQVASIALFCGAYDTVAETARRAHERLLAQIDADGRQPHEVAQSLMAESYTHNLQSWVNLADVCASFDSDLWSRVGADGRGLRRGIDWLLARSARGDASWPSEQTRDFDWSRRIPLAFAYADAFYIDTAGKQWNIEWSADSSAVPKSVYPPHEGIAPYWRLARVNLPQHASNSA
jgi:hypothetical protein